ncbi:MAG: phage head-tail joining protein [Bdellovibrionales bacterium]
MTYTIAQRDALKAAIASGVLSLSYDGNSVQYRSMDELKAALAEVEQGLAKDSGKTQVRRIKIYAEKDL